MDNEQIKRKVGNSEYLYTLHAEIERKADELTFHQIEKALLNGDILETYPDCYWFGRKLFDYWFC